MPQIKSSNEKFEIDPKGLSEFQRLNHEVLMLNELRGGKDAYKLSRAEKGQSGYSFGPTQWDLSKHKKNDDPVRQSFEEILRAYSKADKNPDAPKLDDDTIDDIMRAVKESGESDFVKNNKAAIEAALASDFGIDKIDEIYRSHLAEIERDVKELGDIGRKNPNARAFVESMEGRLLLADFRNQFGPFTDVKKFLAGEKVTFEFKDAGGKTVTKEVQIEGEFTVEQWEKYLGSTKHGSNHPKDVERRQGNVLGVLLEQKVAPDAPTEGGDAPGRLERSGAKESAIEAKADAVLSQAQKAGFVPGEDADLPISPEALTAFHGFRPTERELEALEDPATRRAIYRRVFVEGPGLDRLPNAIAASMLGATLEGTPKDAVGLLQRAIREGGGQTARGLKVDGVLGPKTLAAAEATVAEEEPGRLEERLALGRFRRFAEGVKADPHRADMLDRGFSFIFDPLFPKSEREKGTDTGRALQMVVNKALPSFGAPESVPLAEDGVIGPRTKESVAQAVQALGPESLTARLGRLLGFG